jgi:hypothetical protein
LGILIGIIAGIGGLAGGIYYAITGPKINDILGLVENFAGDIPAEDYVSNDYLDKSILSAITDATGVIGEWNSIAEYDVTTLYNVGNYSATATYGSTAVEAFETPCFIGTKEFAIINDQTTTVKITASVANAVVQVACTDAFKNYFTGYSFALTTAAGTEIPFVAGETRRAFIDPYTFTVTGSATTQTGSTVKIEKSFSGIVAKTLYTVKFDVNSGNVGGATVTISFNDEPVAEIPVDIELNDAL